MKHLLGIATLCCGISCFASPSNNSSVEPTDSLWQEFASPSDASKTKVWWFHGQTEATDEGTTADLEAFKKAGIGGVVYYDQVHGKGEGASDVFSMDWWHELFFSAQGAKRLGLTFEVNISNGYVAGGPWITPKLGMQNIVTSDTVIQGGKVFNGIVSKPEREKTSWDIALIAFPETSECREGRINKPSLSSNIPDVNANSLFDGNGKLMEIPTQGKGKSVYLTVDYQKQYSARCLTYSMNARAKAPNCTMNVPGHHSKDFFGAGFVKLPNIGELEVSDDGTTYRKVCDLTPLYQSLSPISNQQTISFPQTKGRFYRLNLHDWTDSTGRFSRIRLGKISLSADNKIDHWETKSGIIPDFIDSASTITESADCAKAMNRATNGPLTLCKSTNAIDPHQIVNLTDKMDAEGHLTWKVPKGRWHLMRLAYTPTGSKVKHGRNGMSGLECDKMSKEAAIVQFRNYFSVIYDSLAKRGCPPVGMIMDSHEGGPQNWTPGFEEEFRNRRGYDIHPYLPALNGFVVGSTTQTEHFLYDFRRTIADLISDHYYATLDSLCRDKGVTLTAQAVGNALNIDGDNIQAKGRVEKPQGEFWAYQTNGNYDIKESASAAHLYGKPIASAEAFTDAKYTNTLGELKQTADYAFAAGINEFVVCASAYQPWIERVPGNTAGGREYCLNRNNTYWKYSKPFWDYQARCAGMLRKGKPVIDLCVFIGDDAPVKLLANRLPEIPEGYNFDVATTDALLKMRVDRHDVKMPDGMGYRMIVIDGSTYISKKALKKLDEMVRNGALLYANKQNCAQYASKYGIDEGYQQYADSLWGTSKDEKEVHGYGKGRVYQDITLAEALQNEGIWPDMDIKSGNEPHDKIYFNHRKSNKNDIYFVYNHSDKPFKQDISLRTDHHDVELWNPVDITKCPLQTTDSDGRLHLNLSLHPHEAVFLITSNVEKKTIWENKCETKSNDFTDSSPVSHQIDGLWQVLFDKSWGGPEPQLFRDLTDWSKNDNDSIKYYSGEAVYLKSFKIKENTKGKKVILHFDTICSLAKVVVNGHEASTLWCTPYETDITSYIKKGNNTLEIHVVNSLKNRLIGDTSLPKEKRYTYSTTEIAQPSDNLLPSGIIGKVSYIVR